jgi:hypothetical protein
MKRMLLGIAILVTAVNLAVGVAYAAACETTSGVKKCGETCSSTSSGGCSCTGQCSAEEKRWVSGGAGPIAEAEMEELAY